jgi:hypothetical protein
MTPFDPRLTIIAQEARVRSCHVFHCWHAMKAMGKQFHAQAFATFAGIEERHVARIVAALQAHDAMPTTVRASSGKTRLPADWKPPAPADLSPQAASLAKQWTSASYYTQAEAFCNYWRGKLMVDWNATWANNVIRMHSQVMRDQKFGNAPTHSPFEAASVDPRARLERELQTAIMLGRDYEEGVARKALAALDARNNVVPLKANNG